ncbi:MAG: hypothetical protein M3345_06015 [Actinomycetota bacterium]|nr:hypothetical protein [Actinomycetota bacterium]
MRKLIVSLVGLLILAGGMAQAGPLSIASPQDGPSPGGISSDNVEWIKHFPLTDGVGGRIVGKYFYVNDQNKIMIFDISKPEDPQLLDFYLMPQEWLFGREDLDTNGSILVASNLSSVYILDVEDKTNIQLLAQTTGGQHTQSCILDCKWAYGSNGAIHDLRNPAKPVHLDEKWNTGLPGANGHDVNEIAPGIVLTSTQPMMLLDARKDPVHPKVLSLGSNEDARFIHSSIWPRGGKDKFVLAGGETNFQVRCNERNGAFMTWDASRWKKTHSFTMIDEYRMVNGTYVDGNPAANQVGCSSHWLEANPKFKNGGIVAGAFFEHGTRFIDVSSKGKIKEVGYFMPAAGSTGAVYWVTDEIVYAVDYNRGLDILRFTGK